MSLCAHHRFGVLIKTALTAYLVFVVCLTAIGDNPDWLWCALTINGVPAKMQLATGSPVMVVYSYSLA
jgi:hypothetical protein